MTLPAKNSELAASAQKIAYREVLKRTGKGDTFVPVTTARQTGNPNYWTTILAIPGPNGFYQEPKVSVTVDVSTGNVVNYQEESIK